MICLECSAYAKDTLRAEGLLEAAHQYSLGGMTRSASTSTYTVLPAQECQFTSLISRISPVARRATAQGSWPRNAKDASRTGLLGGNSLVLHSVTGDNTPGMFLLVVAYLNTPQNSIKA